MVCLPLVLARGLSRTGFRKVKGQWAWVGCDAAHGRWESILNVDSTSFVILDPPCYAKDCERVFLEWKEIPDADPASFEILPYKVGVSGRLYSRDRNHVYLREHQITGADPESFVVIDALYTRDRSRVYCGTVPMDGADPETFRIMGKSSGWSTTYDRESFVRFNGPAFSDLEISESRPAVNASGYWAKDAQYHYRGAARVVGADYDTFHATDGICGADKDFEYVGPFRKEEFQRAVGQEADQNGQRLE
jgi:DKNYY family protein